MMRTHQYCGILLMIVLLCLTGTAAHATFLRTNSRLSREDQMMTGIASWYSKKSPGIKKTTANMEIFDDTELTCAMWNVPFHQQLRVTNLENGKSVIVRVNDRGPHKRFVETGRIIDLSKRAFEEIAALNQGLIAVKVEFL